MIDLSQNRLPEKVQNIHLMGICGTAMGSLAGMLKEKGFRVTGSDQAVYPPMSTFLDRQGIAVKEGYGPENLNPRPDLVIVGNVITRVNPEAQEMMRLGLPFLSLPQALGHIFLNNKIPLVVTGTHGKTTTASLLASILDQAGLSPGFMIGGILIGYERNYQIGQGPYFVIEGDEYDTAFFDKGPKFLHYRPRYAVLTSIEFDHADIYSDVQSIQKAFSRFLAIIPEDGLLVAHGPDSRIQEILPQAPCPVETYGMERQWNWHLEQIDFQNHGSRFQVYQGDDLFHTFDSPLSGKHNALNFLSLVPILRRLGLSPETIARGLAGFKGVHRRQEVRGIRAGVTVMDDFAHHPTAVRETIQAVKAQNPARRLLAVFEPRTNTSRRNVFQEAYVTAFGGADLILIREAPGLEKIPEEERFSSARLVDDLNRAGQKAYFSPDTETVLTFLSGQLLSGDVVLIMSNGGFDNIHERLLAILSKKEKGQDPPKERGRK
ncbi:MAG TPA: UDP-N-acetylmuramate:L-alanyl-gamma-D-glutamyl-meso-diaminopimelate ligase, partial [Thermodesulfobacteriota bacterium]|nr:UDP-N-acetylmuramate:L-alanyl-gamma-D-glutamyl-meso-diaminopimelate ligase [Thermodesulfobacteriota bacterium]